MSNESTALTQVEYNRRAAQKAKESGLVRVTVIIPEEERESVIKRCGKLRAKHLKKLAEEA